MNIVLIGPSGAGKGTQAEKVAAQYGLRHIATGDLFREDLEHQTALGILAKKYMEQGELVPDEVADAMVEAFLRRLKPEQGVILDGFPRTVYQAQALDELLTGMDRTLDAAIYINVPEEQILSERIPGRLTCKSCQRPFHEKYNPFSSCIEQRCHGEYLYRREDDTPEHTQTRLKIFHRQTSPVVEYYQKTGNLIIIDGLGSIDQVNRTLTEAVAALVKREALRATRAETSEIQALKEVTPPLSPEAATHPSLDIVLLGAPGSGKGTQAEQICTQFNLKHIATGDLFRENLKNETELGKLAKTYMNKGELVPDDVTAAMLKERLQKPDTAGGIVLDGFPRTLPQAEALQGIVDDLKRGINGVLYIKVSDEELVSRLAGRWICRSCQTPFHTKFKPPAKEGGCDVCGGQLYQRDDDKPETVRARLKTFHNQTAPLIDYYREASLLTEVDGEGEVPAVTERVITAMQEMAE
jgi:adenylate kinase